MARDDCGKGGLGVLLRVLPQQGVVIQFVHLLVNAAKCGKGTDYFLAVEVCHALPRRSHDNSKGEPATVRRIYYLNVHIQIFNRH
jgi:hypothetical protein